MDARGRPGRAGNPGKKTMDERATGLKVHNHYGDVPSKSMRKGTVTKPPKMPPGPVPQEDTIVQYLYKTKMCYHWQSGYCLMGNNCNFAHGIHELRIPRSFTVVNEHGQEIPVPENVFNREVASPLTAALPPSHSCCRFLFHQP